MKGASPELLREFGVYPLGIQGPDLTPIQYEQDQKPSLWANGDLPWGVRAGPSGDFSTQRIAEGKEPELTGHRKWVRDSERNCSERSTILEQGPSHLNRSCRPDREHPTAHLSTHTCKPDRCHGMCVSNSDTSSTRTPSTSTETDFLLAHGHPSSLPWHLEVSLSRSSAGVCK